jgi:uncharacterized delta-60 repeat protein
MTSISTLNRAGLFAAALFSSLFAQAQDGILDLTFDADGLVTVGVGTFDDKVHDMAVQPDGKIVLVGQTYSATNYDFVIARLNTDGSLDSDFGTGGVVILPIGSDDDRAWGVAIQSNWQIVVIGETDNGSFVNNIAVARLNNDGTLDFSFGTNGIVTSPIPLASAYPKAVAVGSNGSIFITGGAYSSSQLDLFVAKYDTYGALEPLFGNAGIAVIPVFPLHTDLGNDIALRNNKIIIAGTALNFSHNDFLLAQLNSDGSLDVDFDTDGLVVTAIEGTFNEYANGLAVQDDGKILVVGASNSTFNDFITVRYNEDGSYDTDFGVNGVAITDFGTSTDFADATDVVIQSDGKIVVGGYRNIGVSLSYAMARYEEDGTLDATFGDNGTVTTAFGFGGDDQGLALAIQEDGRILLAGASYDGTQNLISVARYNNPSVSPVTGIEQLNNLELTAYPNPTEGIIKLSSPLILSNSKVVISNALGQAVAEFRTSQNGWADHDFSELPVGLYLMTVSTKANAPLTARVVKW